jgi:hypothetical protein
MSKEHEREPKPRTLDEVAYRAKELLLRDGQHTPLLLVEGRSGDISIPMTDLSPIYEQRMQQFLTAGYLLAKSGHIGELRQLFFISEAWYSTKGANKLPQLPPSQDPKRKEILMISQLVLHTAQANLLVFEMLRNKRGKLIGIRELHSADDVTEINSPLLKAFVFGFELGYAPGRKN